MSRALSLASRIAANRQPFALWFAPRVIDLPLPMQRYDDPFLPYAKAVIKATRERVALYVLDVPAYLALGGAGAVALERTIDFLSDEVACVLHGPFGDARFTALLDKLAFGGDGITLMAGEQYALMTEDRLIAAHWSIQAAGIVSAVRDVPFTLRVLGDEFVYQYRHHDFSEAMQRGIDAL